MFSDGIKYRHRARARCVIFAALVGLSANAQAQRSDDNAITAAEDAFGLTLENEQIGIYSTEEVRGFSPREAGNLRIEGLYFDGSALSSKLFPASMVRVGIAAQGYPFPAPTGIIDLSLRETRGKNLKSVVATAGPYDTTSIEGDALLSLSPDLSLSLGGGIARYTDQPGDSPVLIEGALVASYRPSDNFELKPFLSRYIWIDDGTAPLIFPGAAGLPPRIDRSKFLGQPWTDDGRIDVLGVIATGSPARRVKIQAGLFSSSMRVEGGHIDLFLDVDSNGAMHQLAIADPPTRTSSKSGELRVSYAIPGGLRSHVFHALLRGRLVHRTYDGSAVLDLGAASLFDPILIEEKPDFAFGEQTIDAVRQMTLGVSYEFLWSGRGQLGLGVQQTRYSKLVRLPQDEQAEDRRQPWLYNASAALFLTRHSTLFGSFTRGLEESGTAPEGSTNRGSALPAAETQQFEIGFRQTIGTHSKLVFAYFGIQKPHFANDSSNVFRALGTIRHTGLEASFSSKPVRGLDVLLGALFLKPSISGDAVEMGLIGAKPVGTPRRTIRLDANYTLSGLKNLSIDASIANYSSMFAREDNQLKVPARTLIDVGLRYRLRVDGANATARLAITNLMNVFGWDVLGGNALTTIAPRTARLSLAVDLPSS